MIELLSIDLLLLNLLNVLMFTYFASSVLKNKRPVLSTICAVALLGFIEPQLCELLPGWLSFVIAHISFFAYIFFAFEGSIKEKIIAYCMVYLSVNLTEMMVAAIFGMLGITLESSNIPFICVFAVMCFSTLFMVSRTWKSISLVISSARFMTFFLLPISQFATILLTVFFQSKLSSINLIKEVTASRWIAITFCAVYALSFIADGFFIQGFSRMANDIKERERLQALEAENKMTYDYIKSMENDITGIRKYRHDFLNMLTTVQLALETNTETGAEDAIKLIRQMTQEIHGMSGKRYCDCNIVNCILAHEENKLTQKGVICDFRAEIPEKLHVSELDLCRLLTNLLDNAGESCMQMPDADKRRVYSNMRVCEGFLYVTVRNSRPAGKLTLQSTKKDDTLHGLGLHIIREITAAHGGELIVDEEENAVTFTATLEWKE